MLTNAKQLKFKLWAIGSTYDSKELLRERGYRWGTHKVNHYKAWSIELAEDKVEEEIVFLRSKIYGSSIDIPVEVFDGYNRFFNNKEHLQNSIKYQGKLEWVKSLCLKQAFT